MSVSAAVYARTKGKVVEQFPQLLPLPHKRFLSSVDIDVRRFAGASSLLPSPIFFSPHFFFSLFFFFIIFIFIPRFKRQGNCAARPQFSLRKYPNNSVLIIDKRLSDRTYDIHRMIFKVELNFYATSIYRAPRCNSFVVTFDEKEKFRDHAYVLARNFEKRQKIANSIETSVEK